jgi:virginiamycin A acetyltransferase
MGVKLRFVKWLSYKLRNILKYSENSRTLIKSNYRVKSGKESYQHGDFIVKGKGQLTIGNYCAFGQDIKIILSNHEYNFPTLQNSFYKEKFDSIPYHSTKGFVEIGSDVWIGDNVIILSNVKIGNGAIVGAGSIVTKDVNDYAIVGGNPAKLIKYRFSEDKIAFFREIEWWCWSDEQIINNKELFFTNIHEKSIDELKRIVK